MSERILNVDHREEIAYNGRKFRSRLELETAKTLDALSIPYRYEDRRIILQEGFRCPYQKNKVIDISYTPDFEIGSSILIECKGFETPEWKIKKKLLFKWLMENEPGTCFFQIHDSKKQLLETLDHQWSNLGYIIEVTSRKDSTYSKTYDSIKEAMFDLGIENKSMTPILRSLKKDKEYVYGYSWSLKKSDL